MKHTNLSGDHTWVNAQPFRDKSKPHLETDHFLDFNVSVEFGKDRKSLGRLAGSEPCPDLQAGCSRMLMMDASGRGVPVLGTFWVERKRLYHLAGGSSHTPWGSPPLPPDRGSGPSMAQSSVGKIIVSDQGGRVGKRWSWQQTDFKYHETSFKVLFM